MPIGIWILIAVVAIVAIMSVSYYNRFIVLGNRIDNSLSQIDVQLKRRADLIPNLINTVKGYAKHEKDVMNAVNEARKALVGAKGIEAKVRADGILEGALGKLFAIAENYPDLKANQNFLELQRELTTTEDKVAYSRQFYNDSILSYNNLCERFPANIFAGIYGKKVRKYLEIEPVERKVVKVSF